MEEYVLRFILGALVVMAMDALATNAKFTHLAGLAPLFPTFALFAHIEIGLNRSVSDLQNAVIATGYSLVVYTIYLLALRALLKRNWRFYHATTAALVVWMVGAWTFAELTL